MPLYIREESGDYRAARPQEIVEEARECVGQLFCKGQWIEKLADAADLFACKLAGLKAERFAVLFLNPKRRVIAYEELFFGTLDAASVHPREVVKRALRHNAAALIVAHNHPSGDTTPSTADQTVTVRLKNALALMDVEVLDHLIIGDGYTSLADRGWL